MDTLYLPLINLELELGLLCSKDCAIYEISRTPEVLANPAGNPSTERALSTQITSAIFQINSTKVYLTAVALSINDNIKIVEKIKHGFKRKVSWNKYKSKITTQPKKDLDCMTDLTFRDINRLLVRSFKLGNISTRNSYNRY